MLKATAGVAGLWDHEYVRSSPFGSVAEPPSANSAPSARTRSGPARTVGAKLVLNAVTSSRRQLLPDSKTSSPDAVTLAVYASCPGSTEVRLSRFPPVISKWSESGPCSYAIGAVVGVEERVSAPISPPTMPGPSVEVLLRTTYHFPRFWSKEEALLNMPLMLITLETFPGGDAPVEGGGAGEHAVHAGD